MLQEEHIVSESVAHLKLRIHHEVDGRVIGDSKVQSATSRDHFLFQVLGANLVSAPLPLPSLQLSPVPHSRKTTTGLSQVGGSATFVRWEALPDHDPMPAV